MHACRMGSFAGSHAARNFADRPGWRRKFFVLASSQEIRLHSEADSTRQPFAGSRRARCPRCVCHSSLFERGHREGRASTDTHGPRAKGKHAAVTTGSAGHPAFPARWAYGLYALSPVRRAFGHRHLREAELLANLILASEYQDHAISPSGSRRSSTCMTHAATEAGHRIPRQRFVTFAKRPSDRAGCTDQIMNSEKKKQESF